MRLREISLMARTTLLLFSLSCMLTSCCGHPLIPPLLTTTTHKENPIALETLGRGGDPYQKRREPMSDVSDFSPKDGEPFDRYQARLTNTFGAQQHETERLKEGIAKKKASTKQLGNQLDDLEKQHADLRMALAKLEDTATQTEANPVLFSRYVVQKGDTLQKISRNRYGNFSGWLNIYRFNHTTLTDGPNRIEKGQAILLPNPSTGSNATR